MIDPNRVTEAVMEFMNNPSWKDIFTNAPGGAMERLAISFYFSKFHDQFKPEDFQEYRDLRDEYEKSLTEEDLNYLIENSDKENAKKHYQELLAKLQQSGGQPQGKMRFEKDVAGEQPAQEAAGTGEVSQPQSEETAEQTTEKAEESAQEGADGQETVEETATETTEEKSAEGNQSPAQGEEESKKEPTEEDNVAGSSDSEDNREQDEKLNTALSVALNYLQNEEKQMGGSEDNDEKKK